MPRDGEPGKLDGRKREHKNKRGSQRKRKAKKKLKLPTKELRERKRECSFAHWNQRGEFIVQKRRWGRLNGQLPFRVSKR